MKTKYRNVLIGLACLMVLLGGLVYEIIATRPVRRAVRAYSELISVANRLDLDDDARVLEARPFLSKKLLAAQRVKSAPGGGIVGLPRYINKNFQAWREGEEVWICPTNRVGFVYRMVEEDGRWRFDGLVGLLQSGNIIVPAPDIED